MARLYESASDAELMQKARFSSSLFDQGESGEALRELVIRRDEGRITYRLPEAQERIYEGGRLGGAASAQLAREQSAAYSERLTPERAQELAAETQRIEGQQSQFEEQRAGRFVSSLIERGQAAVSKLPEGSIVASKAGVFGITGGKALTEGQLKLVRKTEKGIGKSIQGLKDFVKEEPVSGLDGGVSSMANVTIAPPRGVPASFEPRAFQGIAGTYNPFPASFEKESVLADKTVYGIGAEKYVSSLFADVPNYSPFQGASKEFRKGQEAVFLFVPGAIDLFAAEIKSKGKLRGGVEASGILGTTIVKGGVQTAESLYTIGRSGGAVKTLFSGTQTAKKEIYGLAGGFSIPIGGRIGKGLKPISTTKAMYGSRIRGPGLLAQTFAEPIGRIRAVGKYARAGFKETKDVTRAAMREAGSEVGGAARLLAYDVTPPSVRAGLYRAGQTLKAQTTVSKAAVAEAKYEIGLAAKQTKLGISRGSMELRGEVGQLAIVKTEALRGAIAKSSLVTGAVGLKAGIDLRVSKAGTALFEFKRATQEKAVGLFDEKIYDAGKLYDRSVPGGDFPTFSRPFPATRAFLSEAKAVSLTVGASSVERAARLPSAARSLFESKLKGFKDPFARERTPFGMPKTPPSIILGQRGRPKTILETPSYSTLRLQELTLFDSAATKASQMLVRKFRDPFSRRMKPLGDSGTVDRYSFVFGKERTKPPKKTFKMDNQLDKLYGGTQMQVGKRGMVQIQRFRPLQEAIQKYRPQRQRTGAQYKEDGYIDFFPFALPQQQRALSYGVGTVRAGFQVLRPVYAQGQRLREDEKQKQGQRGLFGIGTGQRESSKTIQDLLRGTQQRTTQRVVSIGLEAFRQRPVSVPILRITQRVTQKTGLLRPPVTTTRTRQVPRPPEFPFLTPDKPRRRRERGGRSAKTTKGKRGKSQFLPQADILSLFQTQARYGLGGTSNVASTPASRKAYGKFLAGGAIGQFGTAQQRRDEPKRFKGFYDAPRQIQTRRIRFGNLGRLAGKTAKGLVNITRRNKSKRG